MKIKLTQVTLETQGVSVQADYFRTGSTISPISTSIIDAAEIKRNPGSMMDMQRIVQILPGVGNSTDNTNELIVRGGAPDENLTVMDYIEIPSTNHYPNEFNSGGPINMVNTDIIEDIQFSAGGFPAQFGDKMSSVMCVTLREGDRGRTIASNSGINFAGFNSLMEGGFADGKGSWIFSIRKSFLEVLDKIVGLSSSLGLTAIPKYWDSQFKAVYDISQTRKLFFNGIYGNDGMDIVGDPKEKNEKKKGKTDSSSIATVNFHSAQYAFGVSLKSLWGKEGYSVMTLGSIGTSVDMGVTSAFTRRVFDIEGNVKDYSVLQEHSIFTNKSNESFISLKYEIFYNLASSHIISAGAQVQTSSSWDNEVRFITDTTIYYLNPLLPPDTVHFYEGNINKHMGFGKEYKTYGFISDKIHLTPEFDVTLGLRYDYFSYSKQARWSPRISLGYQIFPPTTRLTISFGDYYQIPALPYFSDYRDLGYNRYISDSHSRHFVFGVEHILSEGLKLSLEGYYKYYADLPVSEQFINSQNEMFRSDKILTIGKRHVYGIEIFLQQKQVKDFFATVSVSLSRSQTGDPREPKIVDVYPSTYDYPLIVVVSMGEIIRDVRKTLNEMPFFIKYPAYILPLSDDMEVGFKFRYQSGKPYTPKEYVTWKRVWEGGRKYSDGAWINTNRVNSERYPDYHRLDFQWLSRFHNQGWNINFYVSIQNVYNRKNIADYVYRTDNTREPIYQLAFLPVVGFEVEF